MIAYRPMLDVPRELVQYVGRLLAAERRARGTRTGTRALTCYYQALMVLVWFRKGEDLALLGTGFGVSRATAYRYRDEVVAVLAAQAQDLHTALRRVAADGWSYVISTEVRNDAIGGWGLSGVVKLQQLHDHQWDPARFLQPLQRPMTSHTPSSRRCYSTTQ